MGRPKEHGEQTRQALLDAAADIVGAEGEQGVTVRRVADAAGTTTRAVYSLFGDKDGLLRALFSVAAETMRRHHEAVPVDPDDPTREFPPLALAYRAAALEQPYLYGLWFGRLFTNADADRAEVETSMRSFERVVDAVARSVASGRFPGRDPEATAMQLFALVHGMASLELGCFFNEPATARAAWVDAITAAVDGYRQPPAVPVNTATVTTTATAR
ncbi:MAG TPA: TetR/AcrR family transcriptional regulator [Micromonosporaceae bacterium]|jgi:AcrR family transcriptional regulator|nr:TetR/AcrR family transcriptional regulator [Micromonosporaceae bacterium]